MRVNIPNDLDKYSLEELEKILCEISNESRPIVAEISKRLQKIKEKQKDLKKAS